MPGSIDKYTILKTLGEGASCKVKLAKDSESDTKVAIKLLKSKKMNYNKELYKNEI